MVQRIHRHPRFHRRRVDLLGDGQVRRGGGEDKETFTDLPAQVTDDASGKTLALFRWTQLIVYPQAK